MHWNCLSASYPYTPFSKTNALCFLSTELLRHPEIEKQSVPGLEIYCSGGISSEFELWSGGCELGEVVGTVVWVHLINAGKKPIVRHHWNRCSAACRTRRLNIVTVVPNTSTALPYFFLLCIFFKLSERTWLCPFTGVLKGKESKSFLMMDHVTVVCNLLCWGKIKTFTVATKSRRNLRFQETKVLLENQQNTLQIRAVLKEINKGFFWGREWALCGFAMFQWLSNGWSFRHNFKSSWQQMSVFSNS